MTEPLSVADIATYLTTTGWRREPDSGRTASIWTSPGGEVLLPARDGMGDGELRIREVLDVLALVESRPRRDIADEIGSPLTDIQTFQLFGTGRADGLTTLPDGVRAVNGIRQLLDSAGRAYLAGPHVAFHGVTPAPVRDLLARSRLGPGSLGPGSLGTPAFRVHVPVESPVETVSPFARGLLVLLHDAVGSANQAAAEAAETGDLSRFDDAITAGVSANLCTALSSLGGPDREQPFEIAFAWARGLPSHLPAATIRVEAGRGKVLADGAKHLQRHRSSGPATVLGVIESLHDDAPRADRWRIKVRGDVAAARGVEARRTLWIRLDSPAAYDVAIQAHREQRIVRAQGSLTVVDGRLELLTARSEFGLYPGDQDWIQSPRD